MAELPPETQFLRESLAAVDRMIGQLHVLRASMWERLMDLESAERSRDAYRESLTDEIRSAAKRHAAHHYAELADEAECDLPGLATQ